MDAARRLPPATTPLPLDADQQLAEARGILRVEGQAVLSLAERLDARFCRAVELMRQCRGSVIVSGMGKAGLIGQKIAATLASTGTTSHFLHPGEAVHGDLGRIHRRDVVLMLSFSGATEEVVRLLPSLRDAGITLIAITGNPASPLSRHAAVTLDLGPLDEACSLGLAPSTSTTAMLALGDALALVLSRLRRFGPEDFARFHPGGSLGRKLARVEDVMRPLSDCRVASHRHSVRQVLVEAGRPGRRSGAVMLTDDSGELRGIFTDSDLARLLEARRDAELDRSIGDVMTRLPTTVTQGTRLADALPLMVRRKISELPVVNDQGHPLGMIDITDIVELSWPDATAGPRSTVASAGAGELNGGQQGGGGTERGSEPAEGDTPLTLPFRQPQLPGSDEA